MSRGPGRVERAIRKAFTDAPFMAFGVSELCLIAYPGGSPATVTHKHRVAVTRAADKVSAELGWEPVRFLCGYERLFYVGPLAPLDPPQLVRERMWQSYREAEGRGA